jgi:hypothetical protein
MATFANLTAEQKDIYNVFERDLRAMSGKFQRLCNEMVALDARWNGQILAILAALDDNSIVPNSSGLAGTSSLDSDSEMAALRGDFAAILTTYNTAGKQQLRAKACGQANSQG